MQNGELWCCSSSIKDGKFLNSTFSIFNSTFPPPGGTICGGDAPFGGAFVPPFCATPVATIANARNTESDERGILDMNSGTRAIHHLLTRTTHAANDTAAPTKASLVMKSVMLNANYTISVSLRFSISSTTSFHSLGSFWLVCAILYQTKFKRSSSFTIHKFLGKQVWSVFPNDTAAPTRTSFVRKSPVALKVVASTAEHLKVLGNGLSSP